MTSKLTREENVQAVFDLKAGYTLGLADVEILKRVASMALAAMDSEPVAEVVSVFGDSESIGERELKLLVGIQNMPYGTKFYRHAQPAVDSDFIPKNLDRALGVLGMAIPESREEFNLQTERWIQRLIDRVIRYADEFQEQPAPVVPDEMLCDFYEVNNWTDLVRELVKHVEQLQDSARCNVKPWEDTFPETLLPAYIERIKHADEACRAAMLQESQKSAGASNNCRSRENVQDLLAGNCRENGNSSTKHFREISETSTNRSREHFISLCNEFWNWQELDDITAGEEEPRLEWDGQAFTHRITKALWRMYQAAPGNSPAIPVGWIPVSERMPEKNGTYQVWNGEHVGAVPFLFGSFQCLNPEQVTHWMPTARPPLEMKP